MPPCPTDHEPHPAAAPHVHPPLWHSVAVAIGTYLVAWVLLSAAVLCLGVTCGAARLGYRLMSEAGTP